MNLPRLSLGIVAVYLIPSFWFGANIDSIKSLMKPKSAELRVAYASTLPNVMTMTTEQHLAYLNKEYAACDAGVNYLSIIAEQHQQVPLTNALEVASTLESLCPAPAQ